jgi:hypothetical protein
MWPKLTPSLHFSDLAARPLFLSRYRLRVRPAPPATHRTGSACDGVAMRLRLAGVKPNSEAMRIMISAWRLAIAT